MSGWDSFGVAAERISLRVFQTPPPLVDRWACIFRTLRKAGRGGVTDVSVGTAIWW